MSKAIEDMKKDTFGKAMLATWVVMVISNAWYGIIFTGQVAYILYYNTGEDIGMYLFSIPLDILCVWWFFKDMKGHWSEFGRWCQIKIYKLYRRLDNGHK